MPELPEVETFVKGLQPAVGRTIARTEVIDAKLGLDARAIDCQTIDSIERRGKHIVIDLGGPALVIHLRMSGRLRLECSDQELKYTRLVLHLEDGRAIYFVNPRRLGTARFYPEGFEADLGVEPLSTAFTAELFSSLMGRSRAPVKQVLLDQRRITGVGNIYAAEALWRSKIDPRRPAKSLSTKEAARLHRSVVSVLQEAVDQLGTTIGNSVSDYHPGPGSTGDFGNELAVYGREDEPCKRCKATAIERIKQGGRSTYFCPSCQR